ncbi:MAG: Glu/Leu/Phe/Val dehydrogenase [Planctomycetota bacterium]|jgi:glutamate dehydrogenase (NAD(P)+)|nr:Glu/Leu/Phe/Val dehydrogenase [Planctomycetota bacterium]
MHNDNPLEEPQAPSPALSEDNPFASMMERFDEAAQLLGLDPDLYMLLRRPDREFKFAIPVQLDDGEIEVFSGFRIRHNLSLGPCLGGLRLDKNLNRDELRALAAWTTWKCSALNVPFGGSMGGVNFEPRDHSDEISERVVRRYTSGVNDLIGPQRDILIPDLHTNERMMAWAMDTYSMHARHTVKAVVVGKPLGLGGTHLRNSAIGRGVRVLMERRLDDMQLEGPVDVVIQGAGQVASQVALELNHYGHRIIGMGDLRACYHNSKGLDIPALVKHREQHGSLADFNGGDLVNDKELLSIECDVLIPAAASNQITAKNADDVNAKLVVEAANGPTTRRADNILESRGIPVVPDLLGNSGSVIIAYFEWVQNRAGYYWPIELVEERLDRMINEAYDKARDAANKHKVGLRLATCMLGVERVAYFDKLRGVYG